MDPHSFWGEIDQPVENKLGLSPAEREALGKISRPLAIEGPKFRQPSQQQKVKTEPSPGDPLLINSIKLLSHKRNLDRLLETVDNYKVAIASGELDKMPPLTPAPPIPDIVTFTRSHPIDYYQHQTERLTNRPTEIGHQRARTRLRQSVIQLAAHAGYHTTTISALDLLIDSLQEYLSLFCRSLRQALDHQLELAPDEDIGWSDVLEKVSVEMGVDSCTAPNQYRASILAVGDYYEKSVVSQHSTLVTDCRLRQERYRAELPGDTGGGSWPSQDEIPEMHFPSSEEGMGDSLLDHATPTLDVGMQMLQSLEASGDLDTPMSAESEALSGYSATPSPQVLTPGRAGAHTPHTPHSPAGYQTGGSQGGKKRRRSGGKFM